jgi:MFS family permease
MAFVLAAFFLASAGASAAYLTVSEIFPMETRALAIAFFYAIGTAIGGISGPYLFGQFIHSGSLDQVATGFLIGAGAMVLGGIAELLWGVAAEGRSLEAIAEPLSAERVRAREQRRRADERRGLRRLRPGPGAGGHFFSPAMMGTVGEPEGAAEDRAALERDREIATIALILQEYGAIDVRDLRVRVRARDWGPGRFGGALNEAIHEGRARRLDRRTYGPAGR